MKVIKAKTGTDKDGKAFYKVIGRILETKNGPAIKLDVIPLNWDGWAYINEEDANPRNLPPRAQATREDDIPY